VVQRLVDFYLERHAHVHRTLGAAKFMADQTTRLRDQMTRAEEELRQAKNKVLARSVLRSERPMGRLASLGFHWMYRRLYIPVEEELEAFSRVTVGDLRRLLHDWPIWPLSIVSVGPTTNVHTPA
jgi:predicted Zn-dependent peptidase